MWIVTMPAAFRAAKYPVVVLSEHEYWLRRLPFAMTPTAGGWGRMVICIVLAVVRGARSCQVGAWLVFIGEVRRRRGGFGLKLSWSLALGEVELLLDFLLAL